MNFYFNYFLLIGREHINCLLSTPSCHGISSNTARDSDSSAPRVVCMRVSVLYLIATLML